MVLVGDSNLLEDEGEAGPGVGGALGAEHGVRAENVEVGGKRVEEEGFGKLLDGENVDEERAALEALEREREEHALRGDYGGAEEDHLGVLLAEVVRVREKRDAQLLGRAGVVGAGVGQHGVALADEGLGQELPEVAEAHDGDLELLRVVELLGHSGLVVEGLGRVHGANAEGPVSVGGDGV